MKTICLYFQVHQPFRYRRYRFFDIGNDHYYYDDYAKVDFALVGKLGVAMTFDDTVVGFGMRYDRGLIDITGCGTGRAYNNNIGFYISLSALK